MFCNFDPNYLRNGKQEQKSIDILLKALTESWTSEINPTPYLLLDVNVSKYQNNQFTTTIYKQWKPLSTQNEVADTNDIAIT